MRRTLLGTVLRTAFVAGLPVLALAGCASAAQSPGTGGIAGAATAPPGATPAGGAGGAGGAGANTGLTGAQLNTALDEAVGATTALHLKGAVTEPGKPTVDVDLQLNKDNSAEGTLTAYGVTFPIISVGGVYYQQVTSSYIQYIEGRTKLTDSQSSSLRRITGEWLSSQNGELDQSIRSLEPLTDFVSMTRMVGGAGGDLSYIGTGELNGQKVAQYELKPGTGSLDEVLSIALTGSPLPLELDGGARGTLSYVWNQPTKVSPPPASDIVVLSL